jgi:hypothetical protein
MRNDRHLAIRLRKKGASYNKISKELGIPKSTMHYWFRNLRWSQKIKKELTEKAQRLAKKQMKAMARANKKRWEVWRKQHREEAKKEFPILKSNPLFIAGLMLYWGEGDSSLKREVRLSNADPRIIKLFNKFLRKVCKIPKERIHIILTLYPDLVEEKCKNFWSNKTGVSLKQFGKSQVIYGRHPTRKLENGVCTIRVSSSYGLKEKIITWIDLLNKNLNQTLK